VDKRGLAMTPQINDQRLENNQRRAYAATVGRGRLALKAVVFALPLGFLALFYFYPLATIFRQSLATSVQVQTGISALFTDRYYLEVVLFSVWQALLSTALTLAVGLPCAYVFARYQFRGKTLLRALATVPFVLPTVVVAAAFQALLGPNGVVNTALGSLVGQPRLVNLQDTLVFILIAHVFYNLTIVLRIVGGFWANLDPRIEEAARVLGADRWRVWREATLPLLLPAISAAALLIFLFTFTAFGTVLILGGPRFATLEVEIYRQAINFFNLPVAAALSLLQILATLVLTMLYTRLQERAALPLDLRPETTTLLPVVGWRRRVLLPAARREPTQCLFLCAATHGSPQFIVVRSCNYGLVVDDRRACCLFAATAPALAARTAQSAIYSAAWHIGGDAWLRLLNRAG
jgi:thiamine transport system permease protein